MQIKHSTIVAAILAVISIATLITNIVSNNMTQLLLVTLGWLLIGFFFVKHTGFKLGKKHYVVEKAAVGRGTVRFISWDSYSPCNKIISKIDSHLKNPIKIYPIPGSPKTIRDNIQSICLNGYKKRGNPTIHIDSPIDWGQNPSNDRNWHFKVNALDMVLPHFQLYQITGETEHVASALKVIEDWIDYNLIDGHPNKFKWYDMGSGLRGCLLAKAIEYKVLAREEDNTLSKLIYAADIHIQVLHTEELLNSGNHGLFQMMGLASLCKIAPFLTSAKNAKEDCEKWIKSIIEQQFTEEGIHREHSSQYHPWIIEVLQQLETLNLFSADVFSLAHKAEENTKWMFYPNGQMNRLGDTGQIFVNRYKKQHPHLAYLCGDKQGQKPDTQYQVFIDSGYAYYRSEWDPNKSSDTSYLAINAAYHSQAHKQSDDLSFEWFDRGIEIFTDSGKYSYNTDPFSQFFKSTRAHNTLEIDEQDYPRNRICAYGSALVDGKMIDDVFWAHAHPDRQRMKITHNRHYLLLAGQFLLIIDQVKSKSKHNYRQWFHLSPQLEISKENNGYTLVKDEKTIANYHMFCSSKSEILRFRGEKDNIQGWCSDKYMQAHERTAFCQKANSNNIVIASLFTLHPQTGVPEFGLSNNKLTISNCSGKNILLDLNNHSIDL